MPIYEYRCTKCSHQFDVRKGFEDDSSTPCPVCQEDARRLFSPVPIIFKGSGFYVTDHRPQENSTIADSSGEEKAESSAGAESKSED